MSEDIITITHECELSVPLDFPLDVEIDEFCEKYFMPALRAAIEVELNEINQQEAQ